MYRDFRLLLLGCLIIAPAAHAESARFRKGELLVLPLPETRLSLRPDGGLGASEPALARLLARHGLNRYARLGPDRPDGGALALRSEDPAFDPIAAAAALRATGAFRAVAPNLRLDLYATNPNDLYFLYQWNMRSTANTDANLPEAWDLGKGDPSTVIAIMDNGLDVSHPDLASKVWINPSEIPGNGLDDDANGYIDDVKGWDFGNHDSDPSSEPMFDDSGIDVGFHGTFVAGVAAAATNNSIGIAGAGWNCRFMALKIGDSSGDMTLASVTEAFAYVTERAPAVLNMSFGTKDPSGQSFFQALIDDAGAAGILCVAAAGNAGNDTLNWPAGCDGVLAVGATTEQNARASFSNWGSWVDIAAPGSSIWSSICQNYPLDDLSWFIYVFYFGYDGSDPYMYGDGTSFASPLVAGIAGLVRSRMPNLTPAQVAQRLVATGDVIAYDHPIGPRVNAYRALNDPLVDVGPGPEPAPRALLAAPWPNPFSNGTTIAFTLPASAPVRLAIYDTKGRLARLLVQATLPEGRHVVLWNGQDGRGKALESGIYFASLESDGARKTRKLVLAR